MQVAIQMPSDGTVLAVLKGNPNLEGVPKIEGRLMDLAKDAGTRLMVLDLAQVPMLGSVGIRLFFRCRMQLEKHGGILAIMNPVQFVREVMEISGVNTYLPLVESLEEAMGLLSGE